MSIVTAEGVAKNDRPGLSLIFDNTSCSPLYFAYLEIFVENNIKSVISHDLWPIDYGINFKFLKHI